MSFRPSKRAVHLRRAGRCQQLGWFGSSEISPTSGSTKGTEAARAVMSLATSQAVGLEGTH